MVGKRKGKFVVLEGIGGSGKSTQAEMLGEYLKSCRIPCLVTCEHTRDLPIGAFIEELIKGKRGKMPDLVATQVLYTADRKDHFTTVIEPALDGGVFVISDRYYATGVAYTEEKWRKKILKINKSLVKSPDLTIVVDVSAKEAVNRIGGRGGGDVFDKERKLKKFRKGYKWFVKNSGDECVMIKGDRSVEEIHEQVVKEVKSRRLV